MQVPETGPTNNLAERSSVQQKVLITGGAGFIGSALCEHFLDQGHAVRCMDNLATGKEDNIEHLYELSGFEMVEADIRDLDACLFACKDMDLVLHQAALGSVPRSIKDPVTTNQVNIGGMLNMMEATRRSGITRFVYAASSSTYGDSKELPKVEERIGKPLSPYAVTKLVNEIYAKLYFELYGLETIGLRYFNVFGRRQDPDGAYAAAIPKFIKAFLAGKAPTIHGDGEQTRDFTYIENVVQAVEAAAFTKNERTFGQVFNIAYGQHCSVNQLLKTIREKLAHYQPEVKEVQASHVAERVGDVRDSLASIDKARAELGYDPKFDLERGLEAAIEWYWKSLR